jgi:hypothetical protein
MTNYEQLTELACFMIEQIATRPENRDENGVNWNFVSADVHIDYTGVFDDDMIEEAIDLIYEAAEKPLLH